MAVLERHDSFGVVSCRKLKWLLVSHTGRPKSCEKKSQLTFRYQVNDYSSTDNIDHFGESYRHQLCPLNELGAILRLRRRSTGSIEAQVIQLTILKESWKRWKMKK
jgi:hypothetical protein